MKVFYHLLEEHGWVMSSTGGWMRKIEPEGIWSILPHLEGFRSCHFRTNPSNSQVLVHPELERITELYKEEEAKQLSLSRSEVMALIISELNSEDSGDPLYHAYFNIDVFSKEWGYTYLKINNKYIHKAKTPYEIGSLLSASILSTYLPS